MPVPNLTNKLFNFWAVRRPGGRLSDFQADRVPPRQHSPPLDIAAEILNKLGRTSVAVTAQTDISGGDSTGRSGTSTDVKAARVEVLILELRRCTVRDLSAVLRGDETF